MPVKFLTSFFLFLLPLLAAFACTEYILSGADNIYTIKRKMIEQRAGSLQVLVAGTSQTFHSLNPALFNRPSLNLAAPAQPLYYDCKIVLNYLPRLKNLRLVIIPLDYFSLFFDADNTTLRPYYYYHFWHIDNPVLSKTDIRKYSVLARFKPATCREIFSEMIAEKKINIRFQADGMLENGFNGLQAPADTNGFEKDASSKIKRWNNTLMSKNDFTGNTQNLENLVAILQAKKINVLLLSTPVTQNIYAKYDSTFINMKTRFIRHITSSYSNIKYADFSLDPRFTIKDFYDPNHLNSIGAVKFSKIIRQEYIDQMIP